MNPLGAILNIGSSLIDKLVPDKDEANRLKAELSSQAMQGKLKEVEGQVSIITAEAQGNWIQRSWRPLTMVWFSVLLGMYWFGLAPDYLVNSPGTVDQLFDLLKIGIGGYIVGRSGEKIAEKWNPIK